MNSSATPPTAPGQPVRPSADTQHLKVLSVCYYIAAGLNLVGVCGGLVYAVLGIGLMFTDVAADSNGQISEGVIGGTLAGLGVFILVLSIAAALLNFFAGRFIARRQRKTFCMVVAGISCIGVPLGTILGVFTFIVLARPAVAQMFAAEGAERPATDP